MTPARRARSKPRDQRGVTVVETLVALALATIVAVPVLGLLQSGAASERRHTDVVMALTTGDIAIERVASDIRAASAISTRPSGTLAGSALSLRTRVEGRDRYVVWMIDGDRLLRLVTDEWGNKESVAVVLEGLIESRNTAPFTVTSRSGIALDTSERTGVDLAACATAISVYLEQQTGTNTRMSETTVALRSSIDGEARC